jgi:hypothetical protein
MVLLSNKKVIFLLFLFSSAHYYRSKHYPSTQNHYNLSSDYYCYTIFFFIYMLLHRYLFFSMKVNFPLKKNDYFSLKKIIYLFRINDLIIPLAYLFSFLIFLIYHFSYFLINFRENRLYKLCVDSRNKDKYPILQTCNKDELASKLLRIVSKVIIKYAQDYHFFIHYFVHQVFQQGLRLMINRFDYI